MRAPAVLARVVAALVLAALVALWLQRPGPARYTITADFNRAGLNIRAGDEVRVRDLPVGKVVRIETDRRDFSARYTLSIDRNVRIAYDGGAKIVPKTLFGDKYVELEAAAPGERALDDGGRIPQARTKAVTEFQQVLDRFTPALQSIDPGALGGTIAALAAGIGDGLDLGRTTTGFGLTFQEVANRQGEIARLLAHVPGTAETFGASANDFDAAAANLGKVAQSLSDHDDALGRFLASNADLLTRASDLLTTEHDRIQRITANGFDVLRMVAAHPGAIKGFMAGQAASTVGLPSATHYGVMFAAIPHLIVNFPTPLPSRPVGEGHSALGPEVTLYYPPGPGQPPSEGNPPPPGTPSPSTTPTIDPSGLAPLLQLMAGLAP